MSACPVCGSPHDTWGGVAVHMWKKSDAEHDMAESKDDALIWLSENGHMKRDMSIDTSTDDEPTEPAVSDGGGETVTFPENPDADTDDDLDDGPDIDLDAEPTCPGCGSKEIADAVAVLRNQGKHLNGEHRQLLTDSEFVCAECGGVFDDE